MVLVHVGLVHFVMGHVCIVFVLMVHVCIVHMCLVHVLMVHVCMVHVLTVHVCMVRVWQSEDSSRESVLFYSAGIGGRTWVIRLGSKHLYLLSCLIDLVQYR